ncbi:MAG TPA: hypothetical protein PLO36_02985 [Methanofastidiosum sp.]|nr:hypothetical protein [Methanofastidiosum sp.]HPA49078.1 hypothetical protein [Methanofastidiosum sp.]HQK62894.1 hypothetical protein [Methanofastidiosum sp.]HQQ49259.1 hypothetical protein [Methanofastidiosum sp.]
MKKNAIILIGLLMISFVFMASASASYRQTIVKELECEDEDEEAYDTEFVFTNVPATGPYTLTVSIKGDYNGFDEDEYVKIFIEGTSFGVLPEGYNADWQCSCGFLTKTVTLTQAQISQWMTDGKIKVTLKQGYNVDCFCGESANKSDCKCGDISKCTNTNMVTLESSGANNSLPMDWILKKFGLGKKD